MRVIILVTVALCAVGCKNDGDAPPRGSLYFPNALALSAPDAAGKAHFLFVANNNVDLRYSRGSVVAYSLDHVQAELDRCSAKSECVVDPDSDGVVEDEVLISSHASALAVSPEVSKAGVPTGNLFVTTRTQSSLTFVTLAEDANGKLQMRCGDGSTDCDSNADRADDPFEDSGRIEWPVEPRAVITGSLAELAPDDFGAAGSAARAAAPRYAIVAHQGLLATGGSMSLFVEQRVKGSVASTFLLTDVIDHLKPGLTSVTYDPGSRLIYAAMSGPIQGRFIARVGVAIPRDSAGDPIALRAKLYDAGSLLLEGVRAAASGQDLVFAGPRLLVVSQAPSSLLVADLSGSRGTSLPDSARVADEIVVGAGASHVVTGTIEGRPIALVSCFGARELFVIDLTTMEARSVVPNFSGPFALALDAFRKKVYVADFSSSVIRIVDLAPLFDGRGDGAARVIATLGNPKILQELK